MASPVVLPSSCTREQRRTRIVNVYGIPVTQVLAYCVSCAKEAAWTVDPAETGMSCSYVCDACFAKQPPGTYITADDVYFEKVAQAQLEAEGRFLTPIEVHERLQDGNSYLSKLKRDHEHGRG